MPGGRLPPVHEHEAEGDFPAFALDGVDGFESRAAGGDHVIDARCRLLVSFQARHGLSTSGAGKQIEGNFKAGDNVIVVDDVITTGGSTLKAIDAIEREGGKIAFCLVLVDREEGGRQAIEARGIHVLPLFTRTTLLGE